MLREPGLVDRIVVVDKSVANVYVRTTPHSKNKETEHIVQGPTDGSLSREYVSEWKYYFKIGSVESFEENMEKVQKSLQIDPHDYVPVIYESEMTTFFVEYARALLILFLLISITHKHVFGGFAAKGGSRLFDIGKAKITMVDKNAKNKVSRNLLIHSSLPYHV